MPDERKSSSVDLEDLTVAAFAGMSRALAARESGRKWPWNGPLLIGVVAYPPSGDWPGSDLPGSDLPGFGTGQIILLTARDHTTVIKGLLTNPLPVLHELGLIKDRNRAYTQDDILAALERVSSSSAVKRAAGMARQSLKQFGGSDLQADRATQSKLKKLTGQLHAAPSVDEKLRVLAAARADNASDSSGLLVGIETAIAILEDGRDSIYNPDFYYEIFGGSDQNTAIAKDAAGEIAGADAEGAVATAVGLGAAGMAGGPVVSAGAAATGIFAGAIGGSAGKAVGLLLDWLF